MSDKSTVDKKVMIKSIAKYLVSSKKLKDSFYVYNMEHLSSNIDRWHSLLPSVKPYYAVKCNPDQEIVATLSAANLGFDCASRKEIDDILKWTSPENIIFAHPCKRQDDIYFAKGKGVNLTTFDTLSEVNKLANSNMDCLLRIKVDNPTAKVQLGLKYGAEIEGECEDILSLARKKNVEVVGVSFHVGSASQDPEVYRTAIKGSSHVFDLMERYGYCPSILNIGGGFTSSTFEESAKVIRESLDTYIDPLQTSIIAEPGRFFVENIATFFTPIIGTRFRRNVMEYWITDGLYGSFNCILYDHQHPEVHVLRDVDAEEERYESIVWGATCDSADKLNVGSQAIQLPKLNTGDWLMFPNFGAYTIAGATDFNGINMTKPKVFYV